MRTHRNFPGLMVNLPKVVDHMFNDGFNNQLSEFVKDFNAPSYNVKETDDAFIVELAVPGFEKNDFQIKVHENKLTVSAEVEKKEEKEDKGYTYREFQKSSFSRSFRLPKGKINEENIEAGYTNGVLAITMAKREEAKPQAPQLVEVK